MGQVLLIRHGQASFGTDDYDRLSELGVAQARLLGEWLSRTGRRIDMVATGGLLRHDQTAQACVAALPRELAPASEWKRDPGFDEYDHDELTVRLRPEFADPRALTAFLAQSESPRREFQTMFAAAMERWLSGAHDGDYRETWSGFRERCVGALQRLVDACGASQTVAVFTSGGPISVIAQHALGLADRHAVELNFVLANTGVTTLLYQPGRISLTGLNNFSHLEQAGSQWVTYR